MDKELIKKYLEMFKVSLIILGVALLVSLILLTQIIPQTANYFGNKRKHTETQAKLATMQQELETAKQNKAKREEMSMSGIEVKSIYKNVKNIGNSTADIIAGEIKEINDLIKYYGIKMYKVNYNYDPAEDIFYKEMKDSYSVCNMEMELFATYMKFQSFLKDLYKHEHFLDIQSVEVNPYKKDKSILNVKMNLSLYAERDKSANENREVPPTPSKSPDSTVDVNVEVEPDADLNIDLEF